MRKNKKLQAFFDAISKIDETLLDESMKENVEEIFDEALQEKASEIAKSLDESISIALTSALHDFKSNLDEAVKGKAEILTHKEVKKIKKSADRDIAKLAKTLDETLNHAVDMFLEENRVAMVKEVELEKAKAIDESIKNLVSKFKIETNDKNIDESKKLQRAISAERRAKEELLALKKQVLINEATSELTAVKRDKVVTLCESIDFDGKDEEAFIGKVKDIVSAFVDHQPKEGGSTTPKANENSKNKPSRQWDF